MTLCQAAGFEPKTIKNVKITGVIILLNLVAARVGVSILPNHVQTLQYKGVVYRAVQDIIIAPETRIFFNYFISIYQ
ncbi:MAG: hypothetical protein WBA13_13115 [Microcoleaceae cyanobacterium]